MFKSRRTSFRGTLANVTREPGELRGTWSTSIFFQGTRGIPNPIHFFQGTGDREFEPLFAYE